MESHEAGFPPFPHPLEIPAGFPHSHGYGDGCYIFQDRKTPPGNRNQSHFRRKGVVNHVPGLKRKGCPGTLKPHSKPRTSFIAEAQTAALNPGIADRSGGHRFANPP